MIIDALGFDKEWSQYYLNSRIILKELIDESKIFLKTKEQQ